MQIQPILHAFVICCIVAQGANNPVFSQVPAILDLVRTPGVSDDLELVEDQRAAIDKIIVERKSLGSEFARRYREAPPEEQVRMTTKFKADLAKVDSDVANTLLPHQIERLKQIRMQMVVQVDSTTFGLNRREFTDVLELTEKQKADIQSRALEVNKIVSEKIKKLRAEIEKIQIEARDDLLQSLTPEQRKKYLDLVGRPFNPDQGK